CQRRLARERQQLSRQRRRPLRQVENVLQKLAESIRQAVLAQSQRRVAIDAGEEVVELVGHAAGQGADALHLLRLQELTLQMFAVADVALNADEMRQLALTVHDRRDCERYGKAPAVLAAAGKLALPARSGREVAPGVGVRAGGFAAAVEQARLLA